MIRAARSFYPETTFEVQDLTNLKYNDRSFDIVMAAGVMERIPDWAKAISAKLTSIQSGRNTTSKRPGSFLRSRVCLRSIAVGDLISSKRLMFTTIPRFTKKQERSLNHFSFVAKPILLVAPRNLFCCGVN
jgi:trans-aconitate methyltransferase